MIGGTSAGTLAALTGMQIAHTENVCAVAVKLSTNPFQPVAGLVVPLPNVGWDSLISWPPADVVNPPAIAEVPVGHATDPKVSDGVPAAGAAGEVMVVVCWYVTFASAVALAAVAALVALVAVVALVALVAFGTIRPVLSLPA